ncbi:unnamed protein product [Candida verbasci]|uniref:Palmitoyltransferase n=1 Tax=Candida verbasci TaxID=1227364 RepID=A0A9W4XAD8_9ASCO|nr:unnamed protein product [Candida verbasci]
MNTFILNCESLCCFIASLFPKVFCTFTLTWSLYVILFIMDNHLLINLILIGLYILCLYTYYKIIYIGPGSPLDYADLRINIQENPYGELNQQSPPNFMQLHTLKFGGSQGFRWCSKCNCWKPDRTHHCSSSGKCILKMDHYCPWFSTCIGFFNYKFFIQFLAYVAIYCWIVFIITLISLWNFFTQETFQDEFLSINVVILCVLAFAFGISLIIFLGFSVYLILRNLTTIEFQERRWNFRGGSGKENMFDLGYKKNWESVMGNNISTWLFPISITNHDPKGYLSGINFPVNQDIYEELCHNAELQEQLNRQLKNYRR